MIARNAMNDNHNHSADTGRTLPSDPPTIVDGPSFASIPNSMANMAYPTVAAVTRAVLNVHFDTAPNIEQLTAPTVGQYTRRTGITVMADDLHLLVFLILAPIWSAHQLLTSLQCHALFILPLQPCKFAWTLLW
jgi:hypothetical protein